MTYTEPSSECHRILSCRYFFICKITHNIECVALGLFIKNSLVCNFYDTFHRIKRWNFYVKFRDQYSISSCVILRLMLLTSAISFSVLGIPNSLHEMYMAATISIADIDLPRTNPLSSAFLQM